MHTLFSVNKYNTSVPLEIIYILRHWLTGRRIVDVARQDIKASSSCWLRFVCPVAPYHPLLLLTLSSDAKSWWSSLVPIVFHAINRTVVYVRKEMWGIIECLMCRWRQFLKVKVKFIYLYYGPREEGGKQPAQHVLPEVLPRGPNVSCVLMW